MRISSISRITVDPQTGFTIITLTTLGGLLKGGSSMRSKICAACIGLRSNETAASKRERNRQLSFKSLNPNPMPQSQAVQEFRVLDLRW